MLDIVIREVLLSVRGSCSAIRSLPLAKVKQHSDPLLVTVTSQRIRLFTNFMTLMQILTFAELRVVSMEHLQGVWHTSREEVPFWTPGSVLCWALLMLQRLKPSSPNFSPLFNLNISRYFLDFALNTSPKSLIFFSNLPNEVWEINAEQGPQQEGSRYMQCRIWIILTLYDIIMLNTSP